MAVLLEDGVPIAGYRAIDCKLGLFSGMITDEATRRHLETLVEEKRMLSAGTIRPSMERERGA